MCSSLARSLVSGSRLKGKTREFSLRSEVIEIPSVDIKRCEFKDYHSYFLSTEYAFIHKILFYMHNEEKNVNK